jgi:hypothetical protein
MIIRISAQDNRGSLQLDYDDSKENPFSGYGYGQPPCTNEAFHTAVDIIVADYTREKIKREVKSDN